MREIVERLTENRQVELAKRILENAGYKVSKRSKVNEQYFAKDEPDVQEEYLEILEKDPSIEDVVRELGLEDKIWSKNERRPADKYYRKVISTYYDKKGKKSTKRMKEGVANWNKVPSMYGSYGYDELVSGDLSFQVYDAEDIDAGEGYVVDCYSDGDQKWIDGLCGENYATLEQAKSAVENYISGGRPQRKSSPVKPQEQNKAISLYSNFNLDSDTLDYLKSNFNASSLEHGKSKDMISFYHETSMTDEEISRVIDTLENLLPDWSYGTDVRNEPTFTDDSTGMSITISQNKGNPRSYITIRK